MACVYEGVFLKIFSSPDPDRLDVTAKYRVKKYRDVVADGGTDEASYAYSKGSFKTLAASPPFTDSATTTSGRR